MFKTATMASRKDELVPFVIKEVKGLDTGDQKGAGAYGAVYEVTVKGVRCIAKRIHQILVDEKVPQKEKTTIQEKFRQECVMLSKLTHPNIVHFVGVHYGRTPGDLSLIMECLPTDLANCLETHPHIPLPVKLVILLDVSYGLLYLHSLSPPIIHRDLTANNILLTTDMRAKIADLGVSKLLDPQTITHTQTKVPGSLHYMPPEAMMEKPKYDEKLDVFSFGHLSIYIAIQKFPGVYEVLITNKTLRLGRVQIEKRGSSIDEMGKDHCLLPLTLQCLQDDPENRPTTSELTQKLRDLCTKFPRQLADVLKVSDEQVRIL